MTVTPAELTEQMGAQRRTVDFDTFDIQLQQLLAMLEQGQISIAPAYQRQFRWDAARCSQLIESLILGIPIPNLFMATNPDNTWEVVDGLQRLCAIIKFAGDSKLREKFNLHDELRLGDLQKIDKFNGITFNSLPPHIQQHIRTRPLKVVTLNDKSDAVVRFDLFERLNTGGIILTQQEIRACVYGGKFSDKLDELSKIDDFKIVTKLTDRQKLDGTSEECVLRFFAFLDRYMEFDHSVKEFLNGYMKDATKFSDTVLITREQEFRKVFCSLASAFPGGITRPKRRGNTPINLYEGVVVGAALAMREKVQLNTHDLDSWMGSSDLRKYTTAATNSPLQVRGRIHFCRDRFLGKPYVQPASQ
jgi:hypothetical protein